MYYWTEQEVFEELKLALSSGKPSKKLLTYLDDFAHDKLTTGTPNRPPNFDMQCVGVTTVMYTQLQNQGRHQVIKQIDIPAISPVPNFLSVIAAMCYVTNEIELTNNIGYDHAVIEAGIRSASKFGYAEIIVGDELAHKPTTKPEQASDYNARAYMQGKLIRIDYRGTPYTIATLAEDGTYYTFMQHVTAPKNADILITLENIKAVKGLASTKDLTERVRFSGFNKALKDAFFPTCKKDKILFRHAANLNVQQVESLKRQAAKEAAKNRRKIVMKS